MGFKNKCFTSNCNNQTETDFCHECLANGGIKTKNIYNFINPEIENNYSYHAPKGNQVERYDLIRTKAKELAHMIDELCPNSREKSVAQTNLEQTVMWANASIARNEK